MFVVEYAAPAMTSGTAWVLAGAVLVLSLGAFAYGASASDEGGAATAFFAGIAAFLVAAVLYFVGRVLQVKQKTLEEEEALFGSLTKADKQERERSMREASHRHWRRFWIGLACVGTPLIAMIVIFGSDPQNTWVRSVITVLGLGGTALFLKWLDKWRFVFSNRRVVGETRTHYHVRRDWNPRRAPRR